MTVAMILINSIVIPFMRSWSASESSATPTITIIICIIDNNDNDDDLNLDDGESLSVQSDWED
eukprot:CAMPEP_0201566322 /NCGR_PEP_ID=MMETSP0190_2-20130828/6044_1 /ASSEMBLY_ACC=CAM_ASM_000263 /TAXON_ID=37353 /ORGANISM="Rosalina sp." /LENGTH=62 /DNA_ID=CAMNT_0047984891 /DNA_START=169 /DNA_END=357 /DNA_ORIENTATION=-